VFVDIKRQCRNASTSNHAYRDTQHTKSAHFISLNYPS
jgi:hypothetical protein